MPARVNYNYFLQGNPNDVLLQCLEISHPAFSDVYRFVVNKSDGFTVHIKNADNSITDHFFEFLPAEVTLGKSQDNLDNTLNVKVGDLGDLFKQEILNVRTHEDVKVRMTKPSVVYSEWLLSDPTKVYFAIQNLEIAAYKIDVNGASFSCQARKVNGRKTGVTYNLNDFPCMRGFND